MARARAETPQGNYDATVAAVAGLVAELAQEARTGVTDRLGADQRARTGTKIREVPVGVGIPGAVSPATGLIKNANSTCLIGRALDKDLEAATGRRVRLANDADCFTISEAQEAWSGEAATGKNRVLFGVILGTGCGGGVAVGGRLLQGPNAIAGEWGHNPLPWPQVLEGAQGTMRDERPGPACYCGQRGCIETFVSGPGLERDYEQATETSLPAEEIAALAEKDDSEAVAALFRYEHRLARALASVINVLDPGVIVLGGGLSNIARLYDNVPKFWNEWVFSDTVATPLRPAVHGDSSGVRGAAWLW